MAKTLYFEYRLSPSDYRQMIWFNAFFLRRFQGVFVLLAWIWAFSMVLLELLGVISPSRVTHICCLVVSVCVPVLVVDLVLKSRAFRRDHCGDKAVLRKMIFSDEGVRYANEGDSESHFERWEDFLRVFELRGLFLFYRDARRVTVLPKSAVSEAAGGELRALLTEKMGRYYLRRC